MKVTRHQLEYVAKLCKLTFTEEQYKKIKEQFESSLDQYEILYSVDTAGCQPEVKKLTETQNYDDIAFARNIKDESIIKA